MAASGAVTPGALSRLRGEATSQQIADSTQLAMTPYEYGLDPGAINPATPGSTAAAPPPGPQDAHPSAQRLASGQWAGKTSQLNHAQAAQDQADVWVTVPVDKVTTRGSVSSANPVYATPRGYVPRPGESRGSIPPAIPAGHPY